MIKFYVFKRSFLLALTMVWALAGWSQELRLTGKVTSGDDGTPLPGVSILEKGTSNGTVTDGDGNYAINVKSTGTLVFSFVGFSSQEVPVGARASVDVVLQPDVTALDEVVVIGYGEVQKKDATGAVMAISNKDFNKGVLSSPQDLIVGKFAGVTVTSSNGAPGSGSTIRIRRGSSLTASNDPLFVIDGVPVDNAGIAGLANPLSTINPNDIETYTILKDASATAIYGSRASNGVVIITTKKGAAGKMKLNYNANISASTPAKYLDVLDANEYRALANQMSTTGASGIDAAALTKLGDANTDWQREIFRTAISHDHNLSASGAIAKIPYRVSYGYTDQQGILKTTSFKRHSLNINLNPTFLNDDLKVNVGVKASTTDSNFGDAGAVGNAVSFDPTQPVRDGNDTYGGFFSWLSKGVNNGNSNPVAMLEQTDNQATANRIILNGSVEYKLPFLKDLKANLNLALDKSSGDGFNRAPLSSGWLHSQGTLRGRDNIYASSNESQLLDFYLNYNKEVGDHKFDVTAGYGWQYFYRENSSTNRDAINAPTIGFDPGEYYLVSFFGRLNYSYKDKYLLTGTLRADGSSRFTENPWGVFPSLAFAWRAIDEEFLSGVDALSDLKFRVGYGVTGQQDVGDLYPSLARYLRSNETAQYQLGNEFFFTQRPEPYDRALRWESTTTYNVGVDFGFFNDKITGSVELFEKNTVDMLNRINNAAGSNFSNFVTTNVGSMKNQGIEITLNAMPVATSDLTWNVGVNFTSINSEITRLNATSDPNYPGVNIGGIGVDAFIQNNQVGFPALSFFTYQQVYDANGKPIEGLYVDRSGEGGAAGANVDNKYRFQTPIATMTWGFNTRLNYRKFDFSMTSRLSLGNYVYNQIEAGALYNNIYSLQHFRNVPRQIFDANFTAPQIYSDYYIQNASFFKLDNASLGYDIGSVYGDRLKARVSFTVQNAFVITDYKGIDPELESGIDNNIYPRPRTFLLGVNLTF